MPPASTRGKVCKHLGKVVRLEHTGIPACAGIELIDQVGIKDMRVTHDQRSLWLRRESVEDGIDGIGKGGLQAGILLEAVPDVVVGIDGVIDLDHDEVFGVDVIQRFLALVGAAAAIEQAGRR